MVTDILNLPILLCNKKKCCARLSWNKKYKEFIIEDDHGGKVRLTMDEMDNLKTLLIPK